MKRIKCIFVWLLVSLVLFPQVLFAEVVGTITYIEGRVDKSATDAKCDFVPVVIGDSVSIGDAIRTKTYSKVEVTFDDESKIRLGGSSLVNVNDYKLDDSKNRITSQLNLDRGNMRAIVASTKSKNPFNIVTPNASGTVKGSDVFVAFKKSATSMLVSEGTMRTYNLNFPDKMIKIPEGKASFVSHDAPPMEPRVFLPIEEKTYVAATSPIMIEGSLISKDRINTAAMVVRHSGDVMVIPANSTRPHEPAKKEVLNPGDKVMTGDDGSIEITLDNGHIVVLKANTQLMIEKLTRNPETEDYDNLFNCEYGKVIAKLKKVTKNSSFKIKTPTATCGVRGTIMYLMVGPDVTQGFFEGGSGFMTSMISNVTKIISAGMTAFCDKDGNFTDPSQTTDQQRADFNSGFGNESGDDEYGYTRPDGQGGTGYPDLGTMPGLVTIPEDFKGPFDEIKPNIGTGGGSSVIPEDLVNPVGINIKGAFLQGTTLSGQGELNTSIKTTAAPWSYVEVASSLSGTWQDSQQLSSGQFLNVSDNAKLSEGATILSSVRSKIFVGQAMGTADDGGVTHGWLIGSPENKDDSWRAWLATTYVDPSGGAGLMLGKYYGTNQKEEGGTSGIFEAEGSILTIPVTPNAGIAAADIIDYSGILFGGNLPEYDSAFFDVRTMGATLSAADRKSGSWGLHLMGGTYYLPGDSWQLTISGVTALGAPLLDPARNYTSYYPNTGDYSLKQMYWIGQTKGKYWEQGQMLADFNGIWASKSGDDFSCGYIDGGIAGEYLKDTESDLCLFEAIGSGSWVEAEELMELVDLSSKIETLTNSLQNVVPITEVIGISAGSLSGHIQSAIMDMRLYTTNESWQGIWLSTIDGTYDMQANVTEGWGSTFINDTTNIDLVGNQWTDGMWSADVNGIVNGIEVTGIAAGNYGDGEFDGAGTGVWDAQTAAAEQANE